MMFPSYVNLVLVSCLFTLIAGGNVEQTVLRGVQTSLLSMYVPSKPFACLDGSGTVPFEFVNDDYCDCRDGTDEPGTSACPNGRFFCENKGYIGTLIPSHHVGDSVCDCCDGSDEYETKIVCKNTCFELAQKTQAEREAKRVLHEAGVAKKKEIIAKSIAIKAEQQTHLEELQQELQNVEDELKVKEEMKKLAEIPETAAKERQQKIWDEQRAVREAIARDNQIREMFADLDANGDSMVSIEELQKHTELDTDVENEFTHEEVRSILGADSVNLDEFNNTVFDQISNSYKKLSQSIPEPTPLPEPSAGSTTTPSTPVETTADEEGEETDGDYEDQESSTVPTSLEHQRHTHDDTAPEYDDETKKLILAADQVREEFHEVQRKVSDIKHQIEDLKKQSEIDVGPAGEFSAFIDQCYDYEEREYTYRVCMFKDAKQIPKGGGGDVNVGYWDSWCGPENNKYQKMKYANGATCWNGPARSLTVTLRCGLEHKIIDVREPSRCEYAMILETPSSCDETMATTTLHPEHVEF